MSFHIDVWLFLLARCLVRVIERDMIHCVCLCVFPCYSVDDFFLLFLPSLSMPAFMFIRVPHACCCTRKSYWNNFWWMRLFSVSRLSRCERGVCAWAQSGFLLHHTPLSHTYTGHTYSPLTHIKAEQVWPLYVCEWEVWVWEGSMEQEWPVYVCERGVWCDKNPIYIDYFFFSPFELSRYLHTF